jgi:hypothetical protein
MPQAELILASLKSVEVERAARDAEHELRVKVLALKEYQQRRFRHTYGDLLAHTRYGPASRFFLEELYGPDDFSVRDAQFARVVPAMVRLFPSAVVRTVSALAELHALSEELDTAMGRRLKRVPLDAVGYVETWRATGREVDRTRQITLTLNVARALDLLTRKPLLWSSLRLMRQAARVAGLGELQLFLERGFDRFKAMKGADEFIALVEHRERLLASALFGAQGTKPEQSGETDPVYSLLPSMP